MKQILAPISVDELPSGWEKDFPFTALSVKPYKAAKALVRLPAGVELHLWEWADFKTREEARAWGKRMADECLKYRAKRFYINCEAEWSGVEGYPFVKDPYANLLEATAAFLLTAPKVELAYNGFSGSRTSDGRKLHDAALIRVFNAWVPMVYGALDHPTAGFQAKLDKYKDLPVLRIPMLYAGRYLKDGSFKGQSFADQKRLIEATQPDEVAWYFGNGSKSRWFEFVEEVKQLSSTGPARGYTIKPGDSWWGIAEKRYQDGTLWRRLKAANPVARMEPGVELVIPSKEDLLANP